MLKFSKIISIVTSIVFMFVASSGNIKIISDEFKIQAAENLITGDVNGNGKVNVFDLIRIKNEVFDSKEVNNKVAMDVTGDGVVDYRDAREIQQYILNRNNTFTADLRKSIINLNTEIVSENQPSETSVTAEMAAKADELGNAVSVYDYLYNNMRSEFYFGSRKGAIGAFEQGGGNDIDLSSLLIAMLRYLGYEANYVTAKAGFTEEQIKKWTNADSAEIAHSILSSQKRNNQIVNIENITLYFYDYKYVQVIENGEAYYLDICFKEYESQKSIYDDVYSTSNAEFILENNDMELFDSEISLAESLALEQSSDGYLYSEKIVPKKITALSSENPHEYDWNIEIQEILADDSSDFVFIGFDGIELLKYRSTELYNKNITVSYEVPSDLALLGITIDSIFDLPPDLYGSKMPVTPIVKIDNNKVLTGSDLYIGDTQIFNISIKSGGELKKYEEILTAGEMCSIVFDTGFISSNEFYNSYTTVLKNTETVNQKNNFTYDMQSDILNETNIYTSDYIGSILRFIGIMYFSQVDISSQALSEKTNVHCESVLRFGVIGYKPNVYVGVGNIQIQGQKYGIQKDGQYFLDILGNQTNNISKTGENSKLLSFSFERGLIASELESKVLEEILNVKSLSTASIFRYAQENSIPIISLSKNSEVKLSDLNYDKYDSENIQAEINKGCTVLSTKTNVSIGQWSGIGYIVIAPDGVSYKYMISGGYNGGSSVDPIPLYYGINTALDISCIIEDALIIAGMLALMSSLTLGPVLLIGLGVASITFLTIDILEQSFLLYDYEINGNVEAGLQIWEYTKINSVVTLATMGVGKGVEKLSSTVNKSVLSRKYGKTVIENVENHGFTTTEINSKVNKFKSLGFDQETIDILLKNPKCMYLEDDILKAISKPSSYNQKILADKILKNGDEFSDLIIKYGASDHSCNMLYKYEKDTILAYKNGINNELIEQLDKECGITPDIYIGNSKENPFAFGGKRIINAEQASTIIQKKRDMINKFGEDALNDLRAAAIEFETILKDNAGKKCVTKSNMGPAVAVAYVPDKRKFYFAVNNIDEDVIGKFLDSKLQNRIEGAEILGYAHSKGAGSHAEIKVVNAALLDGNKAENIIVYVNYTKSSVNYEAKACSFVTCPHCEYILDGFNILSDVDVVRKTGEEIIDSASSKVKSLESSLNEKIKEYFTLSNDANPLLHNNSDAKIESVKNVIMISDNS